MQAVIYICIKLYGVLRDALCEPRCACPPNHLYRAPPFRRRRSRRRTAASPWKSTYTRRTHRPQSFLSTQCHALVPQPYRPRAILPALAESQRPWRPKNGPGQNRTGTAEQDSRTGPRRSSERVGVNGHLAGKHHNIIIIHSTVQKK